MIPIRSTSFGYRELLPCAADTKEYIVNWGQCNHPVWKRAKHYWDPNRILTFSRVSASCKHDKYYIGICRWQRIWKILSWGSVPRGTFPRSHGFPRLIAGCGGATSSISLYFCGRWQQRTRKTTTALRRVTICQLPTLLYRTIKKSLESFRQKWRQIPDIVLVIGIRSEFSITRRVFVHPGKTLSIFILPTLCCRNGCVAVPSFQAQMTTCPCSVLRLRVSGKTTAAEFRWRSFCVILSECRTHLVLGTGCWTIRFYSIQTGDLSLLRCRSGQKVKNLPLNYLYSMSFSAFTGSLNIGTPVYIFRYNYTEQISLDKHVSP